MYRHKVKREERGTNHFNEKNLNKTSSGSVKLGGRLTKIQSGKNSSNTSPTESNEYAKGESEGNALEGSNVDLNLEIGF